ncbi:MAG: ABC transporter ATP-binding protein [Planctomycetes bacterium]|nr:ABC transporter ATP-binding protein [Planctomycetota bacterium]
MNRSIKLLNYLYGFARHYWFLIIVAIISIFLYSAISSGRALLLKPFSDALGITFSDKGIGASSANQPSQITVPFESLIKGDTSEQTLLRIAVIFFAMTLLVVILGYIKEFLQEYITAKIVIDIRNKVCSHLMNLSIRFFQDKKSGDLLSRLTNDISITQGAIQFLFGDMIQQPLMILMAFGYMLMIDWKITLLIIVITPLLAMPMIIFGKKIKKYRHKSLVKLGDVTESMHQIFTGIKVVKTFQMEDKEKEDLDKEHRAFFRKFLGVVRAIALIVSTIELVGGILVLVFAVGAVYLIKNGRIDMPTAVTLMGFLFVVSKPLRIIGKTYGSLQASLSGADRVFELLELKPELVDAPDAGEMPAGYSSAVSELQPTIAGSNSPAQTAGYKEIMFDKVWFAYDREPVLKNINLSVKRGEIIAVVGPTGSGKSTLLDLIARFYDPTQGAIRIDGIDIRKIRLASLLNHIAIVGQEPFLFNASIRENIGYGRRDATDEEIRAAAKTAYIADFIESLPEKYQTVIGERGVKLSGGERQRIAIARAILKNPSILLLDEATSALDTESEKIVQSALNELMIGGSLKNELLSPIVGCNFTGSRTKSRTTFVIAHRLSTIQHADRIIVLDKGEIVEEGNHQALVQNSGLYARLHHPDSTS